MTEQEVNKVVDQVIRIFLSIHPETPVTGFEVTDVYSRVVDKMKERHLILL